MRATIERLAREQCVWVSSPRARDYYMYELRISLDELCELIVRAAKGEWRLWKGTTSCTAGHVGEPYYSFSPPIEGRHVYIKFEVTQDDQLRIYSIHDDDQRGTMR